MKVPTIKAASRTKHDLFVRTLFGKTCASRSLVRDGLIVERHVKFAALPTGVDDHQLKLAPEKSLAPEFTFLRDQIILPEYVLRVGHVSKFKSNALCEKFREWLAHSRTNTNYKTNATSFGIKLSSLCNVECNKSMDGLYKSEEC